MVGTEVAEARAVQRTVRRRLGARFWPLGPAFVAAVAYVDPGNFATNLTGGSAYGYQLLWVVVFANATAMLVQYLAAKLGLATGRSLPELLRDQCPRALVYLLWAQAEAMAAATDLAEFVGAALALNLLFGVPLLPAGMLTAVLAFGILICQRYGYRPFERVVTSLLGIVALGLMYDLITAGQVSLPAVAGGLVPKISPDSAMLMSMVGIVGATVMPHVIYLHSAMTQDRLPTTTARQQARALRWLRMDCTLGLGAAGLVNVALLLLAAVLFRRPGGVGFSNLPATFHALQGSIGSVAALGFAVALLTSGLASASVGTYAGQVVMQGFLHRRIPLLARRLITMIPALVVLASGISVTQALVISQVVLSFGIPFALVPLLLITRSRELMHELVNDRRTTAAAGLVVVTIVTLNALLLATAFGGRVH